MNCLTCKSHLPLEGDAWLAETQKQWAALAQAGPALTAEKAAALYELLGAELYGQTVTTKASRPNIFDSVSDYLVSRGGMICL